MEQQEALGFPRRLSLRCCLDERRPQPLPVPARVRVSHVRTRSHACHTCRRAALKAATLGGDVYLVMHQEKCCGMAWGVSVLC